MATSAALRDVVTSFLEQKDWSYAELSDGSLMLSYDGQNGRFRCRLFVDEARSAVVYYSLFPVPVPTGRHEAVLEFINRANLGVVIGNFEFDAAQRQIRYRTSIDVEGDRLTHALLTHVVHANVLAMDRYLPELTEVSQGSAGAQEPTPQEGA
jgi:hypothetical protein